MNAAVVHSYDSPPRYTTFADPLPEASEQLVTVTAAGLHQIVRGLASGKHYGSTGELPFIPGVDGAGRLADGTRVYFGLSRSPFGTFAERALAPAFLCIPLPEGVDDVSAAGLANPAMSSWVALTARAKFSAGESVFILGATGISGQLAVQIANRRGAGRVIAAGRNPRALEKLKDLGADAVISLDQGRDALIAAIRREHSESPIDIVLDYLWGAPAETALAALAQRGLSKSAPRVRYIQIGAIAGPNITLPGAALRSSGLELLGSGFGSASLDEIRQAIGDFFTLASTGAFESSIRTARLSDVEFLWNGPSDGARIVFQP